MFRCGASGQFLYFSLVSTLSGNAVTGASGYISGRKSVDGGSLALLSGNITEPGGGLYQANLYDYDVSGRNIGYLFTASGCVPVSFTVVTSFNVSGNFYPASGVNSTVPIASISGTNAVVPIATISGTNAVVPIATISGINVASGQSVNIFSGQLSGQQVTLTSGMSYTASGIYVNGNITAVVASGDVFLASGHFLFGSGQYYLNSGQRVNVFSGQLSGYLVTAASGVNAIVPPATLSGVVANSGLFVNVPIASISGTEVVATATVASGSLYLASGSLFRNTFASGVLGASGGLPTALGNSGWVSSASGAIVSVYTETISGVNALFDRGSASGIFVNVPINTISGTNAVVPIATISGTEVVAAITVASGTLYLASGSLFRNTFASGVLGASGGLALSWGNSGQVLAASGSTATPPIASISGVNSVVPITTLSGVVANSGLFVNVPINTISGTEVVATATVASGSLYLASGSLFKTTFASGVFGTSGGLPTSWGSSGQVLAASGSAATPPIASISGVNAVVPIATISGTNAVVPPANLSGVNAIVPIDILSGVVANSGLFVTLPKATISGVVANSGLFASVPTASLSGIIPLSGGVYLASGTGTSAVVDSGSIAQIASTLLTVSVSGAIESNAAKQSLATVILKQTGRFNTMASGIASGVAAAVTYLCDEVTPKIIQPVTTTRSGLPISELGLGD